MPPSTAYPGPHPDPRGDLADIALPILAEQRLWYRLHSNRYPALFFGRTGRNRFDASDAAFGVMYLGDSPHCCFVETYGRSDHGAHKVVTYTELAARNLAQLEFERPLRLVDLTGAGLVRVGADNRLGVGDYRISQRWSEAFWAHPDKPDGLLYRSRHDPSCVCLAVYERVAVHATSTDLGSLAVDANQALLGEILDAYAIGYIDE